MYREFETPTARFVATELMFSVIAKPPCGEGFAANVEAPRVGTLRSAQSDNVCVVALTK